MNLNLFDDTAVTEILPRGRDKDSTAPEDGMSPFPAATPLGMAYVPYQQWSEVYGEEEAMCSGTLFPELVFPFRGGNER